MFKVKNQKKHVKLNLNVNNNIICIGVNFPHEDNLLIFEIPNTCSKYQSCIYICISVLNVVHIFQYFYLQSNKYISYFVHG